MKWLNLIFVSLIVSSLLACENKANESAVSNKENGNTPVVSTTSATTAPTIADTTIATTEEITNIIAETNPAVADESKAIPLAKTEITKTPKQIAIEQLTVFMTEQVNRKGGPDFDQIGSVLQTNVDKGIITDQQADALLTMTDSYLIQLDAKGAQLDAKGAQLDASIAQRRDNIAFTNKLIAMLQK